MGLHRFLATGPLRAEGGMLPLTPSDEHHLRDVLRLAPGEEVVLIGDGVESRVRLTQVAGSVRGVPVELAHRAAGPRVTLAQGLARSSKMDEVVRHATELGAWRIVPLVTERSVVRLDEAKASARVHHWRRVAEEAAKQSRRAEVPIIAGITTIAELVATLHDAAVVVCWEQAPGDVGVVQALQRQGADSDREVVVIVGPEGGLTAREVRMCEANGAVVATLGPTILRTETAGVVATALAIHARGGLGACYAQ